MSNFVVTSERGAEFILNHGIHVVSHVVSIVDPSNKWKLNTGDMPTLELRFHDEEDPPRKSTHPCTESQLHDLIRFFDETCWYRDFVLIHCWAGCRRSGAAGYIYAWMQSPGGPLDVAGKANQSAWLSMNAKHEWVIPRLNPNRRMIRIADDILCCNGKMIECCELAYPRNQDG